MDLLRPLGEQAYFVSGFKVVNPAGFVKELAWRGFSFQEILWAGRMTVWDNMNRSVAFQKQLYKIATNAQEQFSAVHDLYNFRSLPSRRISEITGHKPVALGDALISIEYDIRNCIYDALGKKIGQKVIKKDARSTLLALARVHAILARHRLLSTFAIVSLPTQTAIYAEWISSSKDDGYQESRIAGCKEDKVVIRGNLNSPPGTQSTPSLGEECMGLLSAGCYDTEIFDRRAACSSFQSQAAVQALSRFVLVGDRVDENLMKAISELKTALPDHILLKLIQNRDRIYNSLPDDITDAQRAHAVRALMADLASKLKLGAAALRAPSPSVTELMQ